MVHFNLYHNILKNYTASIPGLRVCLNLTNLILNLVLLKIFTLCIANFTQFGRRISFIYNYYGLSCQKDPEAS